MIRSSPFLLICALNAATLIAESPALVRDPSVATVQTVQGILRARLTPVTPSRDVTIVVLIDSLTAENAVRIRREISAALNPAFLKAHRLQLVTASNAAGDFSSPLATPDQLQTALKQVALGKTQPNPLALAETLGGMPPNLPGNWAHTIIVGRLPFFAKDDLWISAWLGEIYRKQRVRLSFWSLDGTAPGWAQSLSGAAMGMVATASFNVFMPMLNDGSTYTEVAWSTKLSQGAWPYTAELRNAAGDRIASLPSLSTADGYLPPLQPYLKARAALDTASPADESATQTVLSLNPADIDALHLTAKRLSDQKKPKEALDYWRPISEIAPADATVWAELSKAAYAAEFFDEAEKALDRSSQGATKDAATLELQSRVRLRRSDFNGALSSVEEALTLAPKLQSLWLLRAECARALKLDAKEAESVERAAALGDVSPIFTKSLISSLLQSGDTAQAISHLRKAQGHLPTDAPGLMEYATFWERAHEPKEAELLWKSALTADPKSEAAYLGLAANYTASSRIREAGQLADNGLALFPKSLPLLLAKEQALELSGDRYAARRLLASLPADSTNLNLLKRRAALEDSYGGSAADAYTSLIKAMIEQHAAQGEIQAACRRGLIASLRDERPDAAKLFAEKLAATGDKSALELLNPATPALSNRVEIPGGADALQFLLLGHAHTHSGPSNILTSAAELIANKNAASGNPAVRAEWQSFSASIRDYFQRIASLNALGQRKEHAYEILLSLQEKSGKARTEKAFDILGLKLRAGKQGVSVKAAEGKSQAKKQDILAALAIDEQAIEETLSKGKSYSLEIPFDIVPTFPSEEFWRKSFFEKEKLPGGLAEAFIVDYRLARVYAAVNSMDRAAASALLRSVSPKYLAERYAIPLWFYSAALSLTGNTAEVPGGDQARPAWAKLVGTDPSSPAAFFEALLRKDDSRLIAFFYTLSQLDTDHQRFFTRSPQRVKRFYDLFRGSLDMQRGGDMRLGESTFTRFLREVPLKDDLTVDFPGSPEVWMVAKGLKVSSGSVAKMTRKMKASAAPDDEDEILIRLATTGYKLNGKQESELANLVAVSRLDAQRSEPLAPESALLLAQGYTSHRGLYPYLIQLGDLETSDYKTLLSLEKQCELLDSVSANIRLGELHAFLAIAGNARESGYLSPQALLSLFRGTLAAIGAAPDSSRMTGAMLDFVVALTPKGQSADAAIRKLLLSEAAPERQRAFDQVLSHQKVPSLDGLLAIQHNLLNPAAPKALDEVERELRKLSVQAVPKTWRLTNERKKSLESFETSQALKVAAKLRSAVAKHRKGGDDELQKLSAQMLTHLEPWVELALVGRVYARFLDGSDLLVSEDPLLARKHEFFSLGPHQGKADWFSPAGVIVSSDGEGSYFVGGLAEFSVAAAEARMAGNHSGGQGHEAFATALFSSVRGTDWRGFNSAMLSSFGASVRLAREWVVESASAPEMREQLAEVTRGILSLGRRKALLNGIDQRDWSAVWEVVSVSDLHFIGDELSERTPSALWRTSELQAMKQAAQHTVEPDMLGSVAPELSGCAQPRLRRYEPYEEYQRNFFPAMLAQRMAELKVNLSWLADNAAWPPERVVQLAEPATVEFLAKLRMRDAWDWKSALESYRGLKIESLEPLLSQQ